MHDYMRGGILSFICFILLLGLMFKWFSDVSNEGTYEGHHTKKVQKGLRLGVVLFIASEVMFFFSFFWAYFHFSLAPTIWIGNMWPPIGLEILNPYQLPLLNTVVLLSSGVSVTLAHRAMIAGFRGVVIWSLGLTIAWGIFFTCCQFYEYLHAPFSINDSCYGSIFYMATGFHGFHVLVGTIFLIVCLYRHIKYHFIQNHHIGFEAAIWYWHFVDVVWIYLYIVVYIWGSK